MGYSLEGDNTASYGDFLFNDNTIIATGDTGIEAEIYQLGDTLKSISSVTIGNIEINGNKILFCNGSYAIASFIYDLGKNMRDNSILNIGYIQMNDNRLNAPNGIGWYLDIYGLGFSMYDNASAHFNDFEFLRNTITSKDDGVLFWRFNNFGISMYHDSAAFFGDFQINNNTINATDSGANGIYFEQVQYFGRQMNDQARFEMDDFNFIGNTITAGNNGIYWEPAYFGTLMGSNSTAIIGNSFITGNEIKVANGHGLYTWWWYYFAYEMYENSMCTAGNSIIMYNVINVTGASGFSGIWTGPYDSGENVYDGSTAIFGDYIVSYNTINTVDADGLQFSIYRVGYNMDGYASVTTGNISVSNNNINSTNGNGIYISDTYQNGYELYDNAKVIMGSIEFNDNLIETGSNGITSDSIYGFGSYLYNNSMFEMSDFYFIDNIITTNFNGIYFEPYYFGAYMYGNSTAIIGNNFITGNEINVVDGYGLYAWWWYWFAYEMYDNSTCTVGDSVIMDNVINVSGSGTYGIWTGPYESGDYIFDNSKAVFGDYTVSYNTINANNSFGIEFDIYYTGYEMYDNSNVTFGQFQITDNNITAPFGTGLYVKFERLAYNVYNNSYLSLDDIIISNNIINAQTIGLDIQYIDCGSLYHTSTAYLPGIIVLGNTVNSSTSSFNYFTDNTPFYNDPGATQVWGDVTLMDNDFDGGIYGVALEWNDPDPTVDQPVFYIINTDIHDGMGGSIGLLLSNITDVYAERVKIDTFDYGIDSNNSNVHFMLNGSIANCAVLDISLYSASYLFMINSTFNNASVFFEDFESLLEVAWFMSVLVQSQVALPVPEAIVAVADVDATEIFNATANSDGQVFYIICMEYQENITGIIKNFNDYTANATKSGAFGVATPNPTMDHTQLVIITLIDDIPPSIFGDNSDTAGTTGDLFYFEINASDNMGIVNVHVNYRFDGTGPYMNHSMNGTGPYWLTEPMLSDYVGFIEYYFAAVDSGGFWVNTTPTTGPITDNDSPILNADDSDTVAYTGELFHLNFNITDNIGVNSTAIWYWFGSDSPLAILLLGDWLDYNATILVPEDSLDTLHYYVTSQDEAGNWVSGPQIDVNITDNDEPSYTWVLNPTIGLAGGSFKVSLMATDNIGITNYTITINGTIYDMVKDGDYYNYTYIIPPGSTENITYSVSFLDNAGNSNTTLDTILTITGVEAEAPNYIWVLQPTAGTTGESVLVSLIATDNTAITYYKIEIDGVLYDMTKDGDYYNYTINIPSDSLTGITYRAIFNDTADNPATTADTTITVTDNKAPTYNWISQPTSGTAGGSVLVSLMALDNIGITYYKIEIDGMMYDMIKDGDYFNYTINIPPDSSASITYDITFKDDANNEVTTGDQVITVTAPPDIDPPEIAWILHPDAGTTGDSLLVSVIAKDHVDIIYYKISVDGTLYDLIKEGDYYNYTINIPADSIASITYFVVFNDSANNPNTATDTVITVTDNDPGTVSNDQTDTSGEEDKVFTFQIDASDNIGISEVKVWYWFGDDNSLKKSLILAEENGTYTGSITPEESGDLHYYFEATDTAGNAFQSDEYTVAIGTAEKEDEEELNVFPFIILVIIIIIVIILFLLTRKKKEAEVIPEVEEGLAKGEEEDKEEGPEQIDASTEEEVIDEGAIDEGPPPSEDDIVDNEDSKDKKL
jgi:hypothetical protein